MLPAQLATKEDGYHLIPQQELGLRLESAHLRSLPDGQQRQRRKLENSQSNNENEMIDDGGDDQVRHHV